jgi:vacuolar protein-sorting-associated protein 4
MSDVNFLEKAIQYVKQARDEDEKENYQEAYKLYLLSLDYFMMTLKCTRLSVFSEHHFSPF